MEKYSPQTRERLMQAETSIRAVLSSGSDGTLVTLGFPGLAFDVQGTSYIDPERFEATMNAPELDACELLLVLVERDEVPEEAWEFLVKSTRAKERKLVHFPIKDYQIPTEADMAGWNELMDEMNDLFENGRTVALSCHYGAGRSGTLAARILIDRGMTADEAITTIRTRFPDSIESEMQIKWLYESEAALRGA